MKRLNIIILGMLSLVQGLQAQEDVGEQLLVFRNTGVVDLLYTSEVDSIVTNATSQIFYAKDTVLVVPFAELDSVAVGSRNEMKFHSDVKEMTSEKDLPWIIRFDGRSVYYRNDTPVTILPQVGMKLFYGIENNPSEASVFPYGLCVKVSAVEEIEGEIRIDVEPVGLEDIFSRLFFAGPITYNVPATASQRHAPVNATIDLGTGFDIDEVGRVEVNGSLKVTGNVVFRIGYQHADLDLAYAYGVDLTLKARESTTHNYEELSSEVNIGTFYKLLNLQAAIGAFADLNAELLLGLDLKRTYHRKLLWTRRGGDSSFEFKDTGQDGPHDDEAKFDLTLNGSVFFGPMVRIDFVTIGDLIGARAKVKLGTEITGEVSLGMLQNMRNYESEAYGNAELNFYGKAAVEGYVTNRHYLAWGDVDEHQVFSIVASLVGYTWNLFPNYQQTTATASTTSEQTVNTDVATAVTAPTPTDIETGFEIVDSQGEVVDSIYVGTILAKPEDMTKAQIFDSKIVLPPTIKRDDLEGYTMRPVFHYANYTISAAPVGIRKDVLLQLYTSTQSNGAMTFISSGPFIGETTVDSINYRMGAYLPVPLKKNIYDKREERPFTPGTYISSEQSLWIVGVWQGETEGKPLSVTFNDDGSGEWQELPFIYTLNQPQSGELLLCYEDGQQRVFRIELIDESKLAIKDKRSHKSINLLRKN